MSEPMSLLRTSPPPAQAVELERWHLSSGDELRSLRLGLRAALPAHRLLPAATPAETTLAPNEEQPADKTRTAEEAGTDEETSADEARAAAEAHAAEVADGVILVATELASNALRHGDPPAVVRLLRGSGEFLVDVADHDVAGAPRLAVVHQRGAGGRGLHIAGTLARELGWYVTATTKHIWASFPLSSAGPRTPPPAR
jgi:serine/threonine-protein kinase RsbW